MNATPPPKKADDLKEQVSGDPSSLSLEDLISEIDSKTPRIMGSEYWKKLESTDEPLLGDYGLNQHIRFSLNDLLFAFPLSNALEIGNKPPITWLPNLPDWALGVSNIRGEIVSIVDLKTFFNLKTATMGRSKRLIIIHNLKIKIGILVDQIMGLLPLDEHAQKLQDSPFRNAEFTDYIKGVIPMEDQPLNILDIEKLLSSQRMTQFNTN